MFGQKRAKINSLEVEVQVLNERLDYYFKCWGEASTARKQMSKELDQALESISGYESEVAELVLGRNQQNTINQALADENRDLSARYSLLEQVLKQLQIPVKLGRKK